MTDVVSDVKQRVGAALERDGRTKAFDIEVIDDSGVVTLKGTVPSHEVRDAAQAVAGKQQGVLGVVNALDVDEDAGLVDDEATPPVVPPVPPSQH